MKIVYGDWQVESGGWAVTQSGECLTFEPADADAAFQISTYVKRDGPVSSEELLKVALRQLDGQAAEAQAVQCGSFSGFTSEYVENSTFWRRWWLARARTHLFVTYNIEISERERHRAVVDWMLSTLGDA